MKLEQIRDVIGIVESGTLRAAAQSLGLAQPALSRSIRELEHELGIELFERQWAACPARPVRAATVAR